MGKPPQVSSPECAALPLAPLTGYQAVTQSADIKLDGSGERKNILVTGASGGMGHYAFQMVKLGNTHVAATCGACNQDLIKGLGADEGLDYKTPEGAALKSPSGKKYDIVIHCAPEIHWATFVPNLSATGKVIGVSAGIFSWVKFALQKLTFSKKVFVPMVMIPNTQSFESIMNLVIEGKLKSIIDSKHPLSKIEDGWRQIMSGHATGKVIIEP